MKPETAIKVQSVSKAFILPHEKQTSIKSMVINIFRHNRSYEKQQVLEDVTFDIHKGEFFGIIGRNGGGKSTMLKMLAGIYSPDKGSIDINGKLTPFIELGVGFNPELTGRENIYLNGALLGFSQKEMEAMYGDIVEFAELEKFMDQKLKNYSSGMQVRLAFSIAIRAKSDILLIDEVLAVGDVNFQKKCVEVFEQLKREGRTIIFVSHSMGYVREFCDRVLVVDKGKVLFQGDTEKGIDVYNKLNFENESRETEAQNKKKATERLGDGRAEITSYKFFDDKGKETIKLAAGAKFSVKMNIKFHDTIKNPAVGIMFRKNPMENLFGINNYYEKQSFGPVKKDEVLTVTASGSMPLAPATYYVSFSVSDVRSAADYIEADNLNNVIKVNVHGEPAWGLVTSDVTMEASKS